MDGMYSAIKNRRGGLLNDQEENAHQMPEEKQPGSGGGMLKRARWALVKRQSLKR
jgi:hypothetical protein